MKRFISLFLAITTIMAFYASEPVKVTWELIGYNSESKSSLCAFTFSNESGKILTDNWAFYFNSFPRVYTPAEGENVKFELVQTGYNKIVPTEGFNLESGKSVTVKYWMKGSLIAISYAPDGGHITIDNSDPYPATINHKPLQIGTFPTTDIFPTAERLYNLYESVNQSATGNPFEIIPGLKSVEVKAGMCSIEALKIVCDDSFNEEKRYAEEFLHNLGLISESNDATKVQLQLLSRADTHRSEGKSNNEYYEIQIYSDCIAVKGVSRDAILNGVKSLICILRNNKEIATLPQARICDFPDLHHRGVMLDIARNYYALNDIKRLLKELSLYKINRLQFHIADDEGWRLEIPGLPELTDICGRRGLTTTEDEFMCQFYAGNGNPDANTTSNGYIRRSEFVDFLKYAKSLGILVIPEIETPGHARAAIIAMKARYKKYIATSPEEANKYRNFDLNDSTYYTSVQGYHDNVLNVAEEGTYRFLEKVFDEIIMMYEEADAEMPYLHVGGDEVAKNPWTKSPSVQAFMTKHGYTTTHEMEEYFITRIADMMDAKGYKIGGWQEAAMRHSEPIHNRLRDKFGGINCWETVPDWGGDTIPYSIANNGYNVILCNVGNFYLDMSYNAHPAERGLHWGGYVDEYRAWDARPFSIYESSTLKLNGKPLDMEHIADGKPQLTSESQKRIKGVQGQLFAETIRSFEQVEYLLFPKIFGLAERAWNTEQLEWQSKSQFNRFIGTELLPQLEEMKFNYRVGMPGIVKKDGKVYMNSAYPQAEIRYTTDGSEPNANSKLWTKPVKIKAKKIKAKAFYLGKESYVTEL